jgi:hypothetical protein
VIFRKKESRLKKLDNKEKERQEKKRKEKEREKGRIKGGF